MLMISIVKPIIRSKNEQNGLQVKPLTILDDS